MYQPFIKDHFRSNEFTIGQKITIDVLYWTHKVLLVFEECYSIVSKRLPTFQRSLSKANGYLYKIYWFCVQLIIYLAKTSKPSYSKHAAARFTRSNSSCMRWSFVTAPNERTIQNESLILEVTESKVKFSLAQFLKAMAVVHEELNAARAFSAKNYLQFKFARGVLPPRTEWLIKCNHLIGSSSGFTTNILSTRSCSSV